MTLIDRGHRRISTRIDLTRMQILGAIAANGPVRSSELTASLGLTKSAVSRHLTALQDAGHVRVVADPRDSRTFLVEVVAAGRAEIESALATGSAQFARAISDWSDDEVDQARQVLERLLAAWDAVDAPDRSVNAPVDGPRWLRNRGGAGRVRS